jgi:hypothetical protein
MPGQTLPLATLEFGREFVDFVDFVFIKQEFQAEQPAFDGDLDLS